MIRQIEEDAAAVIAEVVEKAKLKEGQLFIIGCSSSETIGEHMGTASSKDAAEVMKVSTKRVDKLLQNGKEHMRRELGREGIFSS